MLSITSPIHLMTDELTHSIMLIFQNLSRKTIMNKLVFAASLMSILFVSSNANNSNISVQTQSLKIKSVTGILVYFDEFSGTVIIADTKNKQKSFVLADTAKILKAHARINIKKLSTKIPCTVYFTRKSGKSVALRITQ
jgi:hypothetical protein